MSYKSKQKQAPMTRRQALATLGAGAAAPYFYDPVTTLMRALVDGVITKAAAATSSIQPRTLINYHFNGAPALFYSILPMSPYANKIPVRGKHLNTGITNGSLVYRTKGVASSAGTIYMPNLWASNIATTGGTAPMAKMIENMVIIRGIQGASEGQHGNGAREVTRPVATRPSLMGLVADGSSFPIQSILTGGVDGFSSAFKGMKSGQTIVTDYADPMTQILGAFDNRKDALNSTYVSRREAKDMLIKQALSALGNYASSSAPGAESLFSMRNSAEALVKNGMSAAFAAYPAALAKYKKLISDCGGLATLKISGLTDNSIPLPAPAPEGIKEMSVAFFDGYPQNPDVSTLITSATHPYPMAENFAIAEVLVTQNLSASLTLGNTGIFNMNYINAVAFNDPNTQQNGHGWGHDEHAGGTYTSLIANSFMYQCLYSCLNELISVLTAKNLFSETVFYITSDFGRNYEEPMGTGHAHDACVMQIYSGAITSPSVIGNVSSGSPADYGQNRPVDSIFGIKRPLNIYDATSSVAALARVSSPSDNNPSLLGADGTPLIPKASEAA